ncbi:hypothetical protein [Hymenobacter baengnokdamensis]|uniref:hypothetical protein n=1 Tax=Hymenobacter baengnokdamensis TaxID=2615203 RepID=UPI001E4D2B6D|nr:hypothetical protein [Hymenobacter baengnokdamensis]
MHLVESANFNKGSNKVYLGVLANLVAFACRWSFELGYDGFVSFDSKSALKTHYKEALGAQELGGLRLSEPQPPWHSLSSIIPVSFHLSAMAIATTRHPRRKLGHEPQGVDLTPIVSHPYTELEEQEISAFFQKLRAENDKNPEIVAQRATLAKRQHAG